MAILWSSVSACPAFCLRRCGPASAACAPGARCGVRRLLTTRIIRPRTTLGARATSEVQCITAALTTAEHLFQALRIKNVAFLSQSHRFSAGPVRMVNIARSTGSYLAVNI